VLVSGCGVIKKTAPSFFRVDFLRIRTKRFKFAKTGSGQTKRKLGENRCFHPVAGIPSCNGRYTWVGDLVRSQYPRFENEHGYCLFRREAGCDWSIVKEYLPT
jgi:hypothetical protein